MSKPNTWTKATVKNDWGSSITNVQLSHRYDTDHYDIHSWDLIDNQKSGSIFKVGYWTGTARTGVDYWLISFEADEKTWTCKGSFYCYLTDDDKSGTVECRVYKDGNKGKMEVICPKSSNCTVSLNSPSIVVINWMSKINDSKLISDISLPGTHDSAAINTWTSSNPNSLIKTPYATQNQSITKQLESGIRVLDIRLKVKQTGNSFEFVTCHGDKSFSVDILSFSGFNEFQSFESVLDECNSFLKNYNMETIVMSLKIDDWSNTTDKTTACTDLADILHKNPTSKFTPDNLPLKDLRNKIYFLNRINNNCNLGTPINWADDTIGPILPITSSKRNYEVYVQDNYDEPKDKITAFTNAISNKLTGKVLLNFASAVHGAGIFGVYIMEDFIKYLGESGSAKRKSELGWSLFDYPNRYYFADEYGALNVIGLIISSNFGYSHYPGKFALDYRFNISLRF